MQAFHQPLLPLSLHTVSTTDDDAVALEIVYKQWGSPYTLSTWNLPRNSTCTMTGITCNAFNRVVAISLSGISVKTLHPILFSLTSLTSIILVRMDLKGTIPKDISQLTNLATFITSHNNLSGSLPPSLSLLVSLVDLEVDYNLFKGSIPQELSTLVQLSILDFGNNQMTGTLPIMLSRLTALTSFTGRSNAISGPIPDQYTALKQLRNLALASNFLSGSIPSEFFSFAVLAISVDQNIAMCGPSLHFGPQANTSIGKDCVDKSQGEFV